MSEQVNSASDDRTANNAVRHSYRLLGEAEKAQMVAVKDKGAEFLTLLRDMSAGVCDEPNERELKIAYQRVEEAVFWAVKHITA